MKFAMVLLLGLLTTTAARAETFTLYRSSTVIENARLHVATFDSSDDAPGSQYNRTNCELAATLFQRQPGAKTRFWCEKGRFNKQP